jgi:hypothetical protein
MPLQRFAACECRLDAIAIDARLKVESNCLDFRGSLGQVIPFSYS